MCMGNTYDVPLTLRVFDFRNILAILKRLKDTYKWYQTNLNVFLFFFFSDLIERYGRIHITLIELQLLHSCKSKKY